MDKKNSEEIRRINKTLLICWMAIILILLLAYSIEVFKGSRTIEYIVQFAMIMLIPFVITMFIYRKDKSWDKLCYVVVVGYTFMYAFVMFTGITQMVSNYILPLLCFLILYHKPKLISFTFIITILVNIASLVYQLEMNIVTITNVNEVEIRFAVIIVSFAGGFVSARLYNSIHNDNERYTKELSDKNDEIQEMAIQTIATIANTIDAKDEYTRGHSKRVAEYAVAIASEIGMPSEEVGKIRSIALLHDIGKIGVPDSVLNKPGKLTDDEYELMKQHTVMGAEILKDITLLPGIDIGAKYHHERHDGNGYPEKKSGTDIPTLARVIAVADAFDAMTSNRVYRKQLDIDHVIEELKRCRGTQFDPEMDDALLRLLEENRLKPIVLEETEHLSDVSKIWSRVMEKDEEKYKEKSVSDELTGLYGRNYGEQMIRKAVESNKGTLVVIDVDHFRKINGEAGYLLGDNILCSIARCLERINITDKILARFGGDEFVAFLPNLIEKEEVANTLDLLYEDVRNESGQLEEIKNLTISAGVCICPELKNVYQESFLDADRALYMAKRDGGNCYTFFEKNFGEDGNLQEKNADLLRLKDAVKQEDGKVHNDDMVQAVGLIRKLIAESETPIQVILFTAKANEVSSVSLEGQKQVMDYLETAISRSIKGKDYTLKFSNTQRIIILTKSAEDGAKAVSTHVMKEFYKQYSNKEMSVAYDVIEFF